MFQGKEDDEIKGMRWFMNQQRLKKCWCGCYSAPDGSHAHRQFLPIMALRLCLQRIYSARAAWVLQREAKGAVPTCSVCAHVAPTEGIASTSAHAQTSPWSIWSRAAHQQAPGHQPHQHQEPQASHGAGQSIVSIQQQQQESECWSCKHHFRKGGLVCTGCEKLQPLDKSLDYFQLLAMWVSSIALAVPLCKPLTVLGTKVSVHGQALWCT